MAAGRCQLPATFHLFQTGLYDQNATRQRPRTSRTFLGIVNLSCLVAFSPPSFNSKLLIPGLSPSGLRAQNGRILLNLTVPLKRLTERRFDDREFLVIYLDGVIFGEHHVLCAVGVDFDGEKVVLGIKDGASENHYGIVGGSSRAWYRSRPAILVRHRWVESVAQCDRSRLRPIQSGPMMPEPHRGPRPALTRGVERPLPGKFL